MILNQYLIDINRLEVVKVMEEHNVRLLIHGHTHHSDIYKLSINSISAYRVVLGEWYKEGSMVKVTPENIKLITFSL